MREMGIEFPISQFTKGAFISIFSGAAVMAAVGDITSKSRGAISITLWSFTVTILFWKTLVYFFASE